MNCEKSECLNEANAWCKHCKAEYCKEHIAQCMHCLGWFCQWHIEEHLCAKTSHEKIRFEENGEAEEKGEKKELMSIEETKKPGKEEEIEVHAVSPQKRKTSDFNVINTVDTILEIHHIDVGQGDATLILIKDTKDNIYKMLLIDAGRTSDSVCDYLDQIKGHYGEKKFRPLDYFFATHPDNDHVGGADGVLDLKKGYVTEKTVVYDNGGEGHTGLEQEYVNKILKCGRTRKRPPIGSPKTGGIIFDEHGVILRCLAFNGIMSDGVNGKGVFLHQYGSEGKIHLALDEEEQYPYNLYPPEPNNWSMALHLQFGAFSYFTAGDLSGSYEEDIAHHINHFYGPVSAWKAGHHGADECTSEKVVGFLQGRVCVFSFGITTNHGHPFQSPIDHLESLNNHKVPCQYYCTGQVANRNAKLRQPGKLGPNGLDDQGTVIIIAKKSEVMKSEKFHVAAKNGITTYELPEDRKVVNLENKISRSTFKGKASKPLTDKQKEEKLKNKEARREKVKKDAIRALKQTILDIKKQNWEDLIKDESFKNRFASGVEKLVKSEISLSEDSCLHDQITKGRLKREAEIVIGNRN